MARAFALSTADPELGRDELCALQEYAIGGIETTNCGARAVERRDTHIELGLDPMAGATTQRVIVEVTLAGEQ